MDSDNSSGISPYSNSQTQVITTQSMNIDGMIVGLVTYLKL